MPSDAASICANSCDAVIPMSCNSLYGLLTQLIIYVSSSSPSSCLQMTILYVFLLWNVLLYIVYMVLVISTTGEMSETEILSCYVAMVSLLWYEIIANLSYSEITIIYYWKLANFRDIFPLI